MSYQNHNNDRLTEELEALDLLAEFKDIYKTGQADQQSLIRIRERLQHLPSTSATDEMPIPFSMSNRTTERVSFRRKTMESENKVLPLTQRLNTILVLLVAASIIGAFTVTFTWFHHSNATQGQSTPSSIPTAQEDTQQSPQPYPWARFSLANPTTAWLPTLVHLPGGGDVKGPLLRTTDAGKTWHNVTPPQLRFDTPYTIQALKDGKTAWILDRGPQQETLDQTHDGGIMWQRLSLPQGIFVNMLVFVDQKHGWFLGEHPGYQQTQKLFATIDGGQTWQQRSDQALLQAQPQSDTIQFVDTQTGWLTTVTSSGQQNLFITHNAGSSWSPLPLSKEITAKGPLDFKFVTEKHGYLFVNHYQQKTGKNDVSYFYETDDGGQTWQNQIFESAVPTNVAYPTYMNEQQIQIQDGNIVAVYTKENNRWIQSSFHTLADGTLLFTTFASTAIGIGIVDYSKNPSGIEVGGDQIGLVKTTDSGKTWTKVPLSIPTQTVTPYTMVYLTYAGWTYNTAYEDSGPKTFTPTSQPSSGSSTPLTAKKWLVRFLCTAPTADLTLDGKRISASGCDKGPISTVISFDSAHSIQTVKVEIQKETSWLVVLEACTNEKLCLANTH